MVLQCSILCKLSATVVLSRFGHLWQLICMLTGIIYNDFFVDAQGCCVHNQITCWLLLAHHVWVHVCQMACSRFHLVLWLCHQTLFHVLFGLVATPLGIYQYYHSASWPRLWALFHNIVWPRGRAFGCLSIILFDLVAAPSGLIKILLGLMAVPSGISL